MDANMAYVNASNVEFGSSATVTCKTGYLAASSTVPLRREVHKRSELDASDKALLADAITRTQLCYNAATWPPLNLAQQRQKLSDVPPCRGPGLPELNSNQGRSAHFNP